MASNFTSWLEEGGASSAKTRRHRQFLSFMLAGDDYGVDILRVQEIRGWEDARVIPHAPEYMKGVWNLRGAIVPIMDLRLRFDQQDAECTPTTVVIIVDVGDDQRRVGMVVDSVSDVIEITDEDLRAAPRMGGTVGTEFVSGMALVGDKMVLLLDVDKLFAQDDLAAMATPPV